MKTSSWLGMSTTTQENTKDLTSGVAMPGHLFFFGFFGVFCKTLVEKAILQARLTSTRVTEWCSVSTHSMGPYLLLTPCLATSQAHLHVVGMLLCMSGVNQPSLSTPIYSVPLYGPFNCISFYEFSRRLFVFSLCSSGLISALLVLSTI